MAIVPGISLAVRGPDIGDIFSNALITAQRAQTLKQGPARNRLLDAQTSQAESGATQASQLNRIRSLALFGSEIQGDLQSGNLEAIRAKTLQRIEGLPGRGLPNNDSIELLQMLDDPNVSREAKLQNINQLANNANQRAIQFGAIQGLGGGLTSKQREFGGFTEGLSEEDIQRARRIELGLDPRAVSSAAITAATTPGLTDQVATSEAVIAGKKATATETAKTDVKIGSAERVGRAQERINFLSETGTLEARDRNILKKTSASRVRNIAKAESFRDALQSGLRSSGVGRQAAAFAPIGVWTDQGSFDEIFNSFAEVAARERLKASGEVRPTDADVQGMKAAMFGVGRDEKSNIELLNDFIAEQKDLEAKLSPSAPENPQAAPAQQQPTEIKFLGFE